MKNSNIRGKIVGLALVGKLPMTKNERGARVPDVAALVKTFKADEGDVVTALAWADGNWGGFL